MSGIPAVGTTMSAAAPVSATKQDAASAVGGKGLDYNAFLKLLMAEMSHQDPLNPTDSTQYVAQFATFSNVEQSMQTNKKLDSLMTVSALTQANSLIGRTATSADGSVSGKVNSVRVVDGVVEASLDSGAKVPLVSGTKIE